MRDPERLKIVKEDLEAAARRQITEVIPAPVFVTVSDAAVILGMDERSINQVIAQGLLPTEIQHGVPIIPRHALEAYRQQHAGTSFFLLPPKATPNAVNVPVTYTSFVGRVSERVAIAELLQQAETRLVTLTGPGGSGKTRIATQLASQPETLETFSGGVIFVELAGVDSSERILASIAMTLGMAGGPDAEMLEKLTRLFAGRRTLVILDNLEHLVNSGTVVASLLKTVPEVVVLATSRIPLGISAEHEYPIPPMTIATSSDPATSDAFQLFTDRARTADPTFRFDDETTSIVTQICEQLEGLPLAIELTAGQVRFLPLAALLPRLSQRLALLSGGPGDSPYRHRTMRDNIAWSYDLLTPSDREAFRRLAVFADGFDLSAAEAILGPVTLTPILETVRRLFDQNLLQRSERNSVIPRFRMLETIREFGLERLAQEDDLPGWQSIHANYFLDLAETFANPVAVLEEQLTPALLGADFANLQASLVWFETRGEQDRLTRLAAALCRFWVELQFQQQGILWLERALALGGQQLSLPKARAHVALGMLLLFHAELDRSREHFHEGIGYLREHAAYEDLAVALIWLGMHSTFVNDLPLAQSFVLDAAQNAARTGNQRFVELFAQSVDSNLSVVARERGDLLEATRLTGAALDAATRNRQMRSMRRIQGDLGDLYRLRKQWPEALGLFQLALADGSGGIVLRALTDIIVGVGCVLVAWERFEQAALLFGADTGLRFRMGLSTRLQVDHLLIGQALETARQSLSPADFASAFAEGRSRTIDDIITLILAIAPHTPNNAVVQARWRDLTSRQIEITRLVAAYHTDAEIAASLSLSPRTVGWHVSNILAHLSLSTRRELATLAREEGIIPRVKTRPLDPSSSRISFAQEPPKNQ